jgi:hypothetical protein
MTTDRGTITREAGVDQQAPWAEATRPADRRMPGAPRERKPALAVLAVLLIIGGALAAGLLVVKSNQRIDAIEITQAVPQGETIPASAMQEVQISANSGVGYVAWQYEDEVAQFVTTVGIAKGTLLNNNMLTKSSPLPSGDAEVGLALKDGQIPVNLQPGQTVDIYSTQASSGGGCPGKPGQDLTTGATVISASASVSGDNTTDVVVEMGAESAGQVICNSANGTAGIAIVPGNGAG